MSLEDSFHKKHGTELGFLNCSPTPFLLGYSLNLRRTSEYKETRIYSVCTPPVPQAPLPSEAQCSLSSSTLCVGWTRERGSHETEHGGKMCPQIWRDSSLTLASSVSLASRPKRPLYKGHFFRQVVLTCILTAFYLGW